MKIFLKRFFASFSVFVVALSFVQVVFASSYQTSFSFSVSLRGATRYFDGNNIAFSASIAKSTPYKHATNKTYKAALYRDGWFDDYIGTVTLPRDAAATARWSSVGKGNYYVYLSKANDGITLVDNNVKIYSY